MRYIFFTIAFLLSLNVFAQNYSDSVAIVHLLKADYGTMMTHDLKKHMEHCTDDYLLIENGEIWNMEKEADWYKKNANRIYDRKDYFDFKFLKILGSTAYIVYDLKSDITENGTLTSKRWTESAVFRKVNGQWKIALIHSTPVIKAP